MLLFSTSDTLKNSTFITPWAIMHLLGAIIGYMYIKALFPNLSNVTIIIIYFILHTLYEIKDVYYSYKMNNESWYDINVDNSIQNSIGDTIFTIVGLYIAYRYLNHPNMYEIVIGTTIFIVMILLFWNLPLG